MRRRPSRGWLGLAAVLAAAAAGGWWMSPPDPGPVARDAGADPTPAADDLRQASGRPASVMTPVAAPTKRSERPLTSLASSPDVPPGVPASTWQALRAELAGRPDGEAELQRLAAYFGWTDTWSRWRQAHAAGASAAELAPTTALVEAGLADRLAAREVGAAEAWQIMATLRAADTPDAAERQQRLEAWAASRPAGAFGRGLADPRSAGFATAQAATVAAWQAEPGHDRATLQRRLAALRSTHFGAAPAPAPAPAAGR